MQKEDKNLITKAVTQSLDIATKENSLNNDKSHINYIQISDNKPWNMENEKMLKLSALTYREESLKNGDINYLLN